jgi:MFS family permease
MVTTLENAFNARLGITAIGFSIAFSMLMVGRLIFQVPIGYMSDNYGRKPFILVGLVLMAISTMLLGEVQTIGQLIALRLVQGVAAAGVAAPVFALAADLSSKGGEGRQMSVITMGLGLGIAVGPLLAGVLAVFFFELPFIVIGLLTLAGTGVVYYYMPETVQNEAVLFRD